MELIRRPGLSQQGDCVVTIGSFDGLHLGHRALIERLLWHGQQLGLPTMLLSFEPLPREFLQRDEPPARLTNLRERFRLLQDYGVERFCLLHFNEALRVSSGLQFMQLLAVARARVVIVGHDFRFGRGGEASAQWCASHAAEFGFTVDIVAPVELDGLRVSSGKVRAALERADFAAAQRQLGRAYGMRGRVRGGDRLGRTLGFPTANIAIKRRRAPLQGVFAVRVRGVPDAAGPLPGVANLGTRPMVGGGPMLLEVHLFDFEGELYGCELSVEFVSRLRDERTFESMGAMVLQMQRDAAQARTLLGVAPAPASATAPRGSGG